MEFYSLFQFIRTKDFHESSLFKKGSWSRVFQRSFPALKIADRINKNDEKRGGGKKHKKRKEKKENAERNANYKNEQ